jgi:hypothetical protein
MQNKTIFSRKHLSFLILSFLVSCTTFSPAPTVTPTASLAPLATFTPLPTATLTPLPTASPTPVPAPDRAKYTLNTTVDYDAHTVTVDETILYPNVTGNQLNTLVIAVVPNLWAGSFTLGSISIDGTPTTTYSISGQRMDVALASFVLPHDVLTINIQYSLSLPVIEETDPNVSRPRIYGYTKRQTNLTNWYPFVVPYINGDWVLHDPWYYGEHLVYDSADFEVNLKFTDPATAPIVATSGVAEPQTDFTRYTITSARAFAISASREFQVATTQVGDVLVSSYYYPLYDTAGRVVLRTVGEALQFFSERYGPYSHKSLSVVMADFDDSMEFSGLFFHSPLYYNQYDGKVLNYLIFIAAHETAHQWWFEMVGNDQAMQPWLDEGLSTYSERVYYEVLHPDLVDDWWGYRINFFNPQGFADIAIYDGKGFRPYTNAAYFQGAHFLEDLRARIGDEAFFAFIQDYLAQGNGRIVNANDFFRILKEHTITDYSDIVRQYFQNIY